MWSTRQTMGMKIKSDVEAARKRAELKLKVADSDSNFEYVPIDTNHLPPRTLSRIWCEDRRWITVGMFLVCLVASVPFPCMRLILVGSGDFFSGVEAMVPQGCPTLLPPKSFLSFLEVDGGMVFGEYSFVVAKSANIAWDVIIGRGGQAVMGFISYKVQLGGLVEVMESSPVSYELYTALTFAGSSFPVITALLKRIFSTRRYLARMIWLIISTIYVVSFPTLIAAMTGYVSFSEAWIVLKGGGAIVSWEEFSNGSIRPSGPGEGYLYDGVEYDLDTYLNNNTCITKTSNRYRYGVSTNVWAFVSVAQTLWIFGTYGLWVDSNRKSQLNQAGRRMGTYRAVIDLGDALAQDLGTATCAYPEKKLKKHLSENKLGLTYYQSFKGSTSYIGLTSRKHKALIDIDIAKGDLFGSKNPEESLSRRETD